MDLGLTGKKVLITGASKGIGAGIARRFAEEGCNLVLVARSSDGLATLSDQIQAEAKVSVTIVPADISAKGIAVELAARFPDVDIIVNNAGEDPLGTLTEIDEERWREAWDIKVFGYINMCREFYTTMKQRGGGVIVNIIGVANIMKSASYICGATSTAAISTLTQTLGGASLKDGIRVVGVGPGVTVTSRILQARDRFPEAFAGMDGKSADEIDLDLVASRIAQSHGLARSGRVEEVAALAAFVASPLAGYLTGSVVNTDGGWSRT